MSPIKLTEFSHGAGCGCKISPKILGQILQGQSQAPNERLLVGNDTRDDAAVYLLEDGENTVISTVDFFMPIVNDPFDFGRIASANALSDVYAMGGSPAMALAVLGWPLDKLGPEIAHAVIEGSRALCKEAGVALCGGHSIDSPEPIFGLSVNGFARKEHIKKNGGARAGNLLYLTKPIGVGILTTAEKKNILKEEHAGLAAASMLRLNRIGTELGKLEAVRAMTDVTGFGLGGHLSEICEASGLSALLSFEKIPLLPDLAHYLEQKSFPGGTTRNRESYLPFFDDAELEAFHSQILFDPQTSGGLLFAVDPTAAHEIETLFQKHGLSDFASPIGQIVSGGSKTVIRVI